MSCRVLIVDDSATMRALLRRALGGHAGIEVVGEAREPMEARALIKKLDPDVVTLDIEMPGMNGLDFLEKIMRLRPMPVIMVSSLTQPGARITLEALEIGAFDCIAKPNAADAGALEQLPALVLEAKRASKQLAGRGLAANGARAATIGVDEGVKALDLIAIGSSTGGVEVLIQLLGEFPANCPPTLITQHLPASFTASFAARLDRACRATVSEAASGKVLERGHVYLAPGGHHLTLRRSSGRYHCRLDEDAPVQGHRPSVDVMMKSVAAHFEGRAVGSILTGMGRDGAEGLLAMRRRGFRTLAQDQATSLVYGMPRVAAEIGAVEKQVPIHRMAGEIFALNSARPSALTSSSELAI